MELWSRTRCFAFLRASLRPPSVRPVGTREEEAWKEEVWKRAGRWRSGEVRKVVRKGVEKELRRRGGRGEEEEAHDPRLVATGRVRERTSIDARAGYG